MTASTPEEIARRIRPSLTKLLSLYFRVATYSDLTGAQLSMMMRMAEQGSPRIKQLAHDESISLSTVTNSINQLQERRLVRRVRDEDDKRGVRVQLTRSGKRKLEQVGEERDHYFAEMLRTLDPDLLQYGDKVAEIITALAEAFEARHAAEEE